MWGQEDHVDKDFKFVNTGPSGQAKTREMNFKMFTNLRQLHLLPLPFATPIYN